MRERKASEVKGAFLWELMVNILPEVFFYEIPTIAWQIWSIDVGMKYVRNHPMGIMIQLIDS